LARGNREQPSLTNIDDKAMRLIAWNIRAGGGRRADAIADQLCRWRPDIVCLSEFRGGPPSRRIMEALAAFGLEHQATTADAAAAATNALLIASRWPLTPRALRRAPTEPRRWLATRVSSDGRPFTLALVHIPNMVTGRKAPFLASLLSIARGWRLGPGIMLGDTNCGWPGIDEERPVFDRATEDWLNSLEALGWRDAFRHLRPSERFFTWYSPNGGNGFRLDQAFINRHLLPQLQGVTYEWGHADDAGRRDELSDHAALLLDFEAS
jgi:exonuclease III